MEGYEELLLEEKKLKQLIYRDIITQPRMVAYWTRQIMRSLIFPTKVWYIFWPKIVGCKKNPTITENPNLGLPGRTLL